LPHQIGKTYPLAAMNFSTNHACGKPCSASAAFWLTVAAVLPPSQQGTAAFVYFLITRRPFIRFITI
jgi:hypothetical protein